MIPYTPYSFSLLSRTSGSEASATASSSSSLPITAPPASPKPAIPKSFFEIIPKDIFETVMEFVAGGPLFKKIGFDDANAKRRIDDFYKNIIDFPIYDHKAFDIVLLQRERPSYPLGPALMRKYPRIAEAEILKRSAYRNLKLGKANVKPVFSALRLGTNPLNSDNTVIFIKRGSDGHRVNHRVKVSLGLIRDYDKFEVNSSQLPIYFVATDRGLFVYDPNNTEKPLETPLYGIDLKLKQIEWNWRNASLEGLCDDGSRVSIQFNSSATSDIKKNITKPTKREFAGMLFKNIVSEPLQAAFKSIKSIKKWQIGVIGVGVLMAGLCVAGAVLVATVALPLIVLVGWSLLISGAIPLAFAALLVGKVGVINPLFAGLNQLISGIIKTKTQYNVYFSG